MKWNEEMIRKEFARLDGITGLKGSELPIEFNESERKLGSFRIVNNQPVSFCFSKKYFESDEFAVNSAYEVIRHEYAHFLNFMMHGADCGQPHGKQWKACARMVGARPEAYFKSSQNDAYLKVEKKAEEETEKINALMDALHPGDCLMHPTFGKGTICLIESDGKNVRVEIEFSSGKKKLGAKWISENCRFCKEGA